MKALESVWSSSSSGTICFLFVCRLAMIIRKRLNQLCASPKMLKLNLMMMMNKEEIHRYRSLYLVFSTVFWSVSFCHELFNRDILIVRFIVIIQCEWIHRKRKRNGFNSFSVFSMIPLPGHFFLLLVIFYDPIWRHSILNVLFGQRPFFTHL